MGNQLPENRPEMPSAAKPSEHEASDPVRNPDDSPTAGDKLSNVEMQPVPEQPTTDNAQASDQFDLMELNSARTLTTVATIAGPVSFIIGGVALSSVALVCAILALVKARRVARKPQSAHGGYANVVRQTAIMGLFISAVALVLNTIGLITMLPILMEAMQTGDYSAIFGDAASSIQGTPAPTDGAGGGNAWG